MTVIRRKQQNCEYPNSNNASDTESMNLASASTSDAESELNEPVTQNGACTSRLLRMRVPIFEDFGRLGKSSGKRKQRRFKNRSELQILAEETDEEVQRVQLMDDYKSPFERLMEDRNALSYWNEFTELPEEEQFKLIESKPKQPIQQDATKPENPLSRISSKIKRAMKIKKNMPVKTIEKMEEELLEHFTTRKPEQYISTPFTSFERLLLHAIAQYHNLKSTSFLGMFTRCVEVTKPYNWQPMDIPFCDFVKTLRQ